MHVRRVHCLLVRFEIAMQRTHCSSHENVWSFASYLKVAGIILKGYIHNHFNSIMLQMEENNLIEQLFYDTIATSLNATLWNVEVYLNIDKYPNTKFKQFYLERKIRPVVQLSFVIEKEKFVELIEPPYQNLVKEELKNAVSSARLSNFAALRDQPLYYNQLSEAERKLFKRLGYYYFCKTIRMFNLMNFLEMDSYVSLEASGGTTDIDLLKLISYYKTFGFVTFTDKLMVALKAGSVPMIGKTMDLVAYCAKENNARKQRYRNLEYELQQGTRFQEL